MTANEQPVPDEIGDGDVVPQESDNGPRPGDGVIEDQGSITLPSPTDGRRRLTGPTATEILHVAAANIGTVEKPAGSDRQPFGQAYGMDGVAWCNIFVSEVGHRATGDYSFLGKYAWTPACASWWNSHGRFGREPRPGAVVFFDWGGSKSIQAIDHVGLVVQALDNGLVRTIEGNSAVPGHPDGVWYHDRNPAFIVGYGYPAYGGAVPVDVVIEDNYRPYVAAAPGSRAVSVLDAGDDVKQLQRSLGIPVDGYFGARTKNAVIGFQREHRLQVDGIVGPKTWAALFGSTPNEVPSFPGVTQRGSSGAAVSAAQQQLKDRGWKLDVDGQFGVATDAAVRAFQKQKGLGVDGIVGPKTWSALWT